MAIHWIGAGANIITGSDQTTRDTLGYMLMYDEEAMAIAAFTATYPMQPRNPTGSPTVGGSDALQLQAWIAGPSPDGTAVVVLANYGSDSYLSKRESGCIALGTCPGESSQQLVTIPLTALGIGAGMENGADAWDVRRVWGGEGVEGRIIPISGIGLIRPTVVWDRERACFISLRKWVVDRLGMSGLNE